MPELSLKTLPDPAKIDDKKSYTLRGLHVRTIIELLYQLWRGENIGNSSTVKKNANGDSGYNLSAAATSPPAINSGGVNPASWPFKVYNTSQGGAGQVQINGGDGFVASLNSFIANVNGTPNNTKSGSPATYPQLSVTGNGVIYGYAVPATPGTASPLTSLDIYYAGSVPAADTASPSTYFAFLIATITGYTESGDTVTFSVANATNYGWTSLIYCGSGIQIY